MLGKHFFENKSSASTSSSSDFTITRIDSPKISQETKSRDFDTSSVRSPSTGRKNKKVQPYDDHQSSMSRYEIKELNFAKGAYGRVSLAIDRVSKETVVLKQVPKTTPIRMVQNEVRAGQILEYHPNIAMFHKYMEFPEHHVMVFSYVEGMDLFTFLETVNFAPRSESEARGLVEPILDALIHAKSRGVAHRDIKLENILLDKKGKPSLIDFGLCAITDEGKKCREWCGSDNYLAPEIVRREPYDAFLSDVFSMGIVLFALVFGVFPFENLRVNSRLSSEAKPLPRLRVRFPTDVNVSRPVKDLLLGMLEDNADRRLSLEEVLQHEWITGLSDLKISAEAHLL